MNREILFRAKHMHAFSTNKYLDGEWVEGYLCDENYIDTDAAEYLIDSDTICQYTGLTDTNGRKIWENDIVEISKEKGYFLIEWEEDTARFVMNGNGITVDFDNYWSHEVEVINNIFDNPELLKGEE